jgi:type II secretory pathway pseudopilin PulG
MVAAVIMGSLLYGGIPALAQSTNDPGIQAREQRQQQRIQQGIQSGQLTRGEANRLEAQQGRIQATDDRMQANGNLTGKERAKLTRMQNRASRNIYRKKHNNRTVAIS